MAFETITSEVEEHSSEAIFGSFDGMTSSVGLITGLLHASTHVLLAAALGLAVASAVGMASGQYLGEKHPQLHVALIMGIATLIGTLIPVVPILLMPHPFGLIVGGVLSCVLTGLIAKRRGGKYRQTFVVLALVCVTTVLTGIFTGAGG